MIVERLIATAPTLMGRSSPQRTKSDQYSDEMRRKVQQHLITRLL